MTRLALLVLCITAAVYAQESTTRETVDIGGQTYYFLEGFGGHWDSAVTHCTNQNMQLVGFETDAEWNAVLDYMQANGKASWFWTNGWYNAASGMWEWGTSGVTFDRLDARWSNGEPGGGPWDTERISLNVESRSMYSDAMTITDGVICEAVA